MDGPKTTTKAEMRYLFQFLKKKGVKYLDVKIELADHLALGLEDLWEQQPGLPLELAVNQLYEAFGIFGFGKMIKKKRQLLLKATIKRLHLDIINRLNATHIAAALFATLVMTYLLMTYTPAAIVFLTLFLLLHVLIASVGFQHQQYTKKKGYQFLFLEAPFRYLNRVLNLTFLGLLLGYFWNQGTYLSFSIAGMASFALLYLFFLTQELIWYQRKKNQNLMKKLINLVDIPAEHLIT